MRSPLHLLQIDGSESAAASVRRLLEQSGCLVRAERVETAEQMRAALGRAKWDLVIADYRLADFDVPRALAILHASGLNIPFFVVSDEIDDEKVVALMRAGARDCVMKDRLARLVPAVERELREMDVRQHYRQIEAALGESQDRYRHITEAISDYSFVVRVENGRVVETRHNAACVAVTGYTEAEFAANPSLWFEMIAVEDRSAVLEQAQRILAGEPALALEHRIVRKDGAIRWIRNTSVSRRDVHGVVVAYEGLIQDITDRRQMEVALRESEEKARHLAVFPELNPNPVMEFSSDGALVYANPAAFAMAAVAGVAELPSLLPPETQKIVSECLATGRPCLRLETKNGLRTLSWSFYPIASQQAVHCYAGDITERLQLEERFHQAQKMEAVGQLAGGVAHDFNNLLTVILGQCSLLSCCEAVAEAQVAESLKEIQAAGERAANLTRQLLAFSRRQPMQSTPLDLNEVVSNVGRMLQRLIGEDIVLHIRLLPGGAMIEGDAGLIEMVLLNLAINARDAMPGGGELWLELAKETFSETAARCHPAARPGNFICLRLRDSGSGIAAEHLPHIFEPFFTTKEIGKGTGLGLATVHGIVEQHRGWIAVESRPGEGATFHIRLPCLPEGVALGGSRPGAAWVCGGDETILVVEDEAAVRALVVKILETRGYHVLAASDGAEARALWRLHADAVDLLLTDLIMPGGVSGAQLAEQLQAEKPGLRVIYMSGYQGDTAARGLTLLEGRNFLQKPFDSAHLAEVVRACLGSAQL
jgi:PAS domain S-box-containing protein